MTFGYLMRGLVQSLGAYFIASLLLSLLVGILWRRTSGRHFRATVTAERLFACRLLPSCGGLLTGVLVALGYALWEARVDDERVGVAALAAAAAGLAAIGHGCTRAMVVCWRTSKIRRELDSAVGAMLPAHPLPAAVIESAFPVVAIVGLVTSRLFVSRSVLEACSAEELEAVLAHEQAHARQRDNLRRLAMAGAPDFLGLCPAGRRLEAAWMHAAELAADERAAERRDGGMHLASALVKVARLATASATPLPASALYRGEPITERVHRLLEPPPAVAARRWPAWARILAPAMLAATFAALLPVLHAAGEQLLALGR